MKAEAANQIRWLICRDVPEILAIEDKTLDAWDERIITSFMKQRNYIGIVSESPDGPIDAWAIYELLPEAIFILRIAVNKEDRCCGLGKQMINRLKDKLSQQRRKCLITKVHESNLSAQLFFQRCGFFATELRDELIQFEYHI